MSFMNKLGSSRDLSIFMISFISSFKIMNVAMPYSNNFFWIAAYVAYAAAVDLNGIKTLLANSLSTFSIKGKPALVMFVKVHLKIHVIVLLYAIEFYMHLTLADETFAKALRSLKTCVLVKTIYVKN